MDAWVTYFDIQRKKLKAQGKDWASPNVDNHLPSAQVKAISGTNLGRALSRKHALTLFACTFCRLREKRGRGTR